MTLAAHHPAGGGAAHVIVLASLVVIGLGVYGFSRWRNRRDRGD